MQNYELLQRLSLSIEKHFPATTKSMINPFGRGKLKSYSEIARSYKIFGQMVNPLDARRRYTDFAQTSLRAGLRYTVQTARYRTRRKTVYLWHGV